nr:RNA polymerase I termination factor-like [Ipomoea batatas]
MKRKERNNDMLAANPVYIVKGVGVEGDKSFEEETFTKMKSDNEGVERMKKKKKPAGDNTRGALMEDANGITVEKSEKKKRKREVQSNNNESYAVSQDTANNVNSTATEMLESKRKHEKKARTITDDCTKGLTCAEGIADFSVNETQASGVGNDNISRKQVFPESNVPESGKGQNKVVELIRGKWFSKIEDEIVKETVLKYIEVHNLGEEGLDMVLNCRSHPEVKHCWKVIGAAIPYRPYLSVYHRAQILFRRSEIPKWSEEEKALILEHVKLNGNEWKSLADKLGRHKIHVRDTWRRIYLPNLKKGPWSQDEYQNLFDLVNSDLQLRILKEKRSRHGMLRDNISFTAISNKLSTRTCGKCCWKWYCHLASPMVAEGTWSDSDDYRLIDALYTLDATCIKNVDWDNLLEHRSGELCLKRWKQMVLHIGNHQSKPFSEHVEVLAKRYCPSLIEVREAWDSKPVVP